MNMGQIEKNSTEKAGNGQKTGLAWAKGKLPFG